MSRLQIDMKHQETTNDVHDVNCCELISGSAESCYKLFTILKNYKKASSAAPLRLPRASVKNQRSNFGLVRSSRWEVMDVLETESEDLKSVAVAVFAAVISRYFWGNLIAAGAWCPISALETHFRLLNRIMDVIRDPRAHN